MLYESGIELELSDRMKEKFMEVLEGSLREVVLNIPYEIDHKGGDDDHMKEDKLPEKPKDMTE
jgi:hypothetical protein